MTELAAAVVGAITGAAIAYFCSVRLADREHRARRDDEARTLARRQGEMRVALATSLEANIGILRDIAKEFQTMMFRRRSTFCCSKPPRN